MCILLILCVTPTLPFFDSLFRSSAGPRPNSHPLLVVYVVGGITPGEIRRINEVVSNQSSKSEVRLHVYCTITHSSIECSVLTHMVGNYWIVSHIKAKGFNFSSFHKQDVTGLPTVDFSKASRMLLWSFPNYISMRWNGSNATNVSKLVIIAIMLIRTYVLEYTRPVGVVAVICV